MTKGIPEMSVCVVVNLRLKIEGLVKNLFVKQLVSQIPTLPLQS